MQNSETNYRAWLKKAEEDEFAGEQILKGKRFAAPACFHYQQMTEKHMKGLLIFHGKEFPKIHDLVVLAGLIKEVEPEIEDYREQIAYLSRYYVETRYPGDFPEFTLEECGKAKDAAMQIKKFVLKKAEK